MTNLQDFVSRTTLAEFIRNLAREILTADMERIEAVIPGPRRKK